MNWTIDFFTVFISEFNNFPLLFGLAWCVLLPSLIISLLWINVVSNRRPKRKIDVFAARMMLMVPIYALTAGITLRFPGAGLYLRMFREIYETIAVYSFFSMLVCFLARNGSPIRLLRILSSKPSQNHLVPLCCLQPQPLNTGFIWWTRFGVLQFVVLKPLLSSLSVCCEVLGIYGEGEFFNSEVCYPYISFIATWSQMSALYALTMFYAAAAPQLSPMRPVPKFLTIKLVIFMMYWQGLLLAAVRDLIPNNVVVSAEVVSSHIHELLLLVEMLPCSILLIYAFRPSDFSHAPAEQTPRSRYTPLSSGGLAPVSPPVSTTPSRQPPSRDPAAELEMVEPPRAQTQKSAAELPGPVLQTEGARAAPRQGLRRALRVLDQGTRALRALASGIGRPRGYEQLRDPEAPEASAAVDSAGEHGTKSPEAPLEELEELARAGSADAGRAGNAGGGGAVGVDRRGMRARLLAPSAPASSPGEEREADSAGTDGDADADADAGAGAGASASDADPSASDADPETDADDAAGSSHVPFRYLLDAVNVLDIAHDTRKMLRGYPPPVQRSPPPP